jgi:hypothetical protein
MPRAAAMVCKGFLLLFPFVFNGLRAAFFLLTPIRDGDSL